ncbi:MAG: histidine ammonia-lyase [Acholeplasmataceae bacterium]|nr:histidine ammonia-lyase [Acholeplasmataceae bacterium]
MIILDGKNLTLKQLNQIARHHEMVKIDEKQYECINKARAYVDFLVEEQKPVYGINTGFGKLATESINKEEVSQLQKNLLMSHACGVGKMLDEDVVRAMLALRVNALIKGYSGIRPCVIEKMVEFLNKNLISVVYEKGSLGASGDLALLSHMSLPLIGLGEVMIDGKVMSADEGLKIKDIKPIEKLSAKEGLSLINGTQAMSAIGGLALYDAIKLMKISNMAFALSMEALKGITSALDPKVHEIRGQEGQKIVASAMKSYLRNSHLAIPQDEKRVQDSYSLRCSPQVHGATYDALKHIKEIVNREMNAVTDNPLIFADEKEAISAGNFHGQPLALAFDYLGIAMAELANISERRIERMVNPQLSNGLPAFLVKKPGLNSGFMIVQYTAASLVSENKVLAHPASVDSIPSSANQEDHVSMGSISARKAKTIVDHVYQVVSMEMMTACQAIDFRGNELLGPVTKKVYDHIRNEIPFLDQDTIMHPYLVKIENIIREDSFLNLFE